MSDIGSDLETEVMNAVFNNQTMILPVSSIYVAAHTGPAGNDGQSNEVDASDYSRAETLPSDWSVLDENDPARVENSSEIFFDRADSNWGDIEELTLWDSETGGEVLWVNGNVKRRIDTADRLAIDIADATFELS